MSDRDARHKASMEKLKARVDDKVAQATEQRGLLLVNTGNGKGKTTAAWGTVTRALGYGYKVGVVQFIKGLWECGERNRLEEDPNLSVAIWLRALPGILKTAKQTPSPVRKYGKKQRKCWLTQTPTWWCWMKSPTC